MRSIFGILLALTLVSTVTGQGETSLRGDVRDETGAVIVGATVTVVDAKGDSRNTQSNGSGTFSFEDLPFGIYTVRVENEGFASYEQAGVTVGPDAGPLNVTLGIEAVETEVNVSDENVVDTSPDANASAIVLKDEDIQALPDDEEDLAAALQALAGPGAGPNGGGIYVDGFSADSLPPRDTIREIRINSNPFSSEFDRLGYGRIQIFTKPGSDRFRGSVEYEFEDEALNSRNPFLDNRPDFQKREFSARLGGPIIKDRASFFVYFDKEDTDSNSLINALTLDQNLDPVDTRSSVARPTSELRIYPRVDFQLNENNTLNFRYGFRRESGENAGIGGFNLLSRGYATEDTRQFYRVTETAILSPKIVNEIRFQYQSSESTEAGSVGGPTVRVLDAFTGGGSNVGDSFNNNDSLELHNFTSFLLGKHSLKVGGRLRRSSRVDSSPSDFAGTFTFTSLDQYRDAILGNAVPTQFSIAGGEPEARVSQTDVGIFAQEDWRISPSLTLSFGLRYEYQTNISSNADVAPRFGFAWAPFASGGDPKTVIRGGWGIFYDRFDAGLTLQQRRFNGINQQRFIVDDPSILSNVVFTLDGVSNVPTVDELSAFAQEQTIRTSSPQTRSPYTSQFAVSIERQLPFKSTLSATYVNTAGRRLLRSRNINAPILGDRPSPEEGNIFQYESTGRLNQQQMILNFRTRFGKYSVFANYSLNYAKSDTDGAGSFPVDQYDLTGEYGRSSLDSRHRFVVGGSYDAPLGLRFRPFVIFRSGSPFNITTGEDANGDTLFNERPTFAELFARCDELSLTDPVCDPSGTGDLNAIVPRNYGTGPDFFIVNLRTSKQFKFGTREGGDSGSGGGRRGGRFGGPFGGGRGGGGGGSDAKYSLEFTVQVRNLFNNTNFSSPVGNLRSSLFGQSLSTAGGFGFGRGSSSGGNRRIELEVQFEF